MRKERIKKMKKYIVYAYDYEDEIMGTAYIYAFDEDSAADLANKLSLIRSDKCQSFMISECIC